MKKGRWHKVKQYFKFFFEQIPRNSEKSVDFRAV